MDNNSFPDPWVPVADHQRRSVEKELLTEIGDQHPLHGLSIEVLAVRNDRDDALIRIKDRNGFAVVHLTWSGQVEESPFPWSDFHENIESAIRPPKSSRS